ncbi:P12 [Sclerotinia sclerotiorum mycoreovirus 4]|uniref:P12 n=1 Tax=Sclerotinia sclerotiorum mycoreovirus 4 TaxID=1840528 RepID=UPI0007C1DF45|nr:P12 [Sclerotinia sclerotiorum mycoreovirus 4]ANC52170.1 P12 [Sclerotinia sclerotiorum mycoreovirus 4]
MPLTSQNFTIATVIIERMNRNQNNRREIIAKPAFLTLLFSKKDDALKNPEFRGLDLDAFYATKDMTDTNDVRARLGSSNGLKFHYVKGVPTISQRAEAPVNGKMIVVWTPVLSGSALHVLNRVLLSMYSEYVINGIPELLAYAKSLNSAQAVNSIIFDSLTAARFVAMNPDFDYANLFGHPPADGEDDPVDTLTIEEAERNYLLAVAPSQGTIAVAIQCGGLGLAHQMSVSMRSNGFQCGMTLVRRESKVRRTVVNGFADRAMVMLPRTFDESQDFVEEVDV